MMMPNSNYIIREARIDDAEAIATINVRTWQYAYKGQMPADLLNNLSIQKWMKKWMKELSDPEPFTKIFVTDVDDTVVGFCVVGKSKEGGMSETGEVHAIYVNKDYMNKGLGGKLIDAGIQYLKNSGFKKACLSA